MKSGLIIFVRNPVLSKVKTRLAATIGEEKALQVCKHLLQHTHTSTKDISVTKFVYYADYINEDDIWNGFEKKLQQGNNLGQRMQIAFQELFEADFTKVCIIGSDCYELNSNIIERAFEKLNTADIVIGPVTDGGYYLLGLNKLIPELFINKSWSTETVFADTIKDATSLQINFHQLPVLNDIDTEKDLRNSTLAFFI
ncbi:TIGR04282 family arsenosugar biosynthesis glycosyltransferase [Ferruginibacter sp.]